MVNLIRYSVGCCYLLFSRRVVPSATIRRGDCPGRASSSLLSTLLPPRVTNSVQDIVAGMTARRFTIASIGSPRALEPGDRDFEQGPWSLAIARRRDDQPRMRLAVG